MLAISSIRRGFASPAPPKNPPPRGSISILKMGGDSLGVRGWRYCPGGLRFFGRGGTRIPAVYCLREIWVFLDTTDLSASTISERFSWGPVFLGLDDFSSVFFDFDVLSFANLSQLDDDQQEVDHHDTDSDDFVYNLSTSVFSSLPSPKN